MKMNGSKMKRAPRRRVRVLEWFCFSCYSFLLDTPSYLYNMHLIMRYLTTLAKKQFICITWHLQIIGIKPFS